MGSTKCIIHIKISDRRQLLCMFRIIFLFFFVEPHIFQKQNITIFKKSYLLLDFLSNWIVCFLNLIRLKRTVQIPKIRHFNLYTSDRLDVSCIYKHTLIPRSSESLGTSGVNRYFSVTPFGLPCSICKRKNLSFSNTWYNTFFRYDVWLLPLCVISKRCKSTTVTSMLPWKNEKREVDL